MAALLGGLLLIRLRQPAIVGYIVAGVALGPTGLGMVENTEAVQVLAELGVIMLLFLIGAELSLKSFKAVYKLALSAAALQIFLALAVFFGVGALKGWSVEKAVVFAFATALSSTAVTIKILEETDDLRTPVGRTTVSVLIAQDLAVIPMILIVGAFGGEGGMDFETAAMAIAGKLLLSVSLLAGLIWFLSARGRVSIPFAGWIASRAEIMPLAALALCFTFATASGAMGLSPAYGAFISGLIAGNSDVRSTLHKAAEPVQAVLLMVFFLSIGLLIDLRYIAENWVGVMIVLGAVTVLKTVGNVAILHVLGEPWGRSFHAGVAMAQIGEFSFVICAAGLAAKVLTGDGYNLMIAVIALSLVISPMWLAVARRLHDMTLGRFMVVPPEEPSAP